jgi:tetratricopeptide (TPR) repeat protein
VFACRSIIVVLSFGLAASAADPPKSDPDKLARDLGSAVFAERDKASRELWKLGEAARSALEKAARSDDPEVAKRAEDILEKFNWGIFPDTPAGVLKQIKEFRSNELERQTAAISALLRAEPRGVDTLALVLSHELEAERRGELYRHLLVESRDAVPLAMFREKSDRAEAILRIGATGPDPEAWLDYALFMQRRDRLPAATTHLDTIARRPGPLQVSAAASLAVASHLAGRSTDALKRLRALPKDSLAPHLLPSMLEDARAWTELAEESDADEGPPNLGLSLFRHRKSGNRPKTDELLDAARKAGAEGDRERAAETGLALFLNEKPLDGIAVLKQRQAHPRLLADVYAGRLMFKEVLELLGDGPIAKELDDEDDARDRVYYEMRKARVFAQIGRKDDAVQLFNRIHAASRERDHYIVRELMRAELRAGCFDLAAEHAGVAIDALDRIGNRFAAAPEPFELLFDEDAEAARGLWRAFRKLPATAAEAPGATMRRVRALLLGKPNEKQVQDARTALAAPPTGEDSQADRVRHTRAAAALARRAERWDEVEKHLRTAVQLWSFDRDGNLRTPEDIRQQTAASFEGPRAWMFSTNETVKIAIDLGEFLVERGRPAEAAKVFEQAWRQYPGNPIPLYLSGRALLAAHDETEGKRRIALAHAVALGDAQYRGRFLHELCERGQMADLRIARDDAARCAWFWTPYRGNVWNAMARASFLLKEFEPSAVAIERNLHFLLKTPNVVFVDGIGYISVPTNVRANRARAVLAEGKTDAAFAESKAILQLLPGQTEFLTAIVPEFERVGKKAEADALFAITWTKLETLRRENPESAWLPATMAFAAAGCRREPDAALAYAKKAVDREPDIRWHREVLAEVLFRRGERAAAVAIGEELRKIDHRSHYFRRLLDRYKTGDVASPLPLSPEED